MLNVSIAKHKKHATFFGITGLMLITAFIQVPCPICDGVGSVSTAVGMENVSVSNLKYDQRYLNMDFCMGYTLYQYAVSIDLTNSGTEDATGWIKLVLKDIYKGNVLDIKYVNVEVPKQQTITGSFSVFFQTSYDIPPAVTVDAGVEYGGVDCLTCSGSGKLPLNVWLMAKLLKSSLMQITQVTQEFKPPPYVIPLPPEGE